MDHIDHEPSPAEGPVRVLAIHTATRPPLGADTWVHAQIIKALDRSRHVVHVAYAPNMSSGEPTPTGEALAGIDDLRSVPVSPGPQLPERWTLPTTIRTLLAVLSTVPNMLKLTWYMHAHRIDIVHTSDRPRDALASVLLSKVTRASSIVHVHVLYDTTWMGRVLRWSITHADARIAVSEFVKRSLTRAGMPAESTFVVRNAIDPDAWVPGRGREYVRHEFSISPETPVVITVSRLFREKGTADLIAAMDLVRRDHPDVRLLVVGEGEPYMSELLSLVDTLALNDHVIFTGRRSDVPELMAAADVFAMPSFEEPFGLVYAEAMAMELPVVALDNGGTREVVVHGRHGLLSYPADTDALTANILTLLGDHALRRRMGIAGRQWVERHFRIERMASDTADVYRRVLAQ